MKAWFAALESRERQLLLAGGAVLIVLLVYLGVWEPLQGKVRSLNQTVQDQQDTLAWMQGAVAQAKALRASGPARGQLATGQSLLSLVDSSARARQLGGALKRVQPEGDRQVHIWMEAASFDALVDWLAELDRTQGVRVINSVIEAKESAGLVDARLVVEVAG